MKKLEVNQDTCIGCGMCIQLDEEHFDFSNSGTSYAKSQDNLDSPQLAQAIDGCPVEAIKITQSDEACNCNNNCQCAQNNDDGQCHCSESCNCE